MNKKRRQQVSDISDKLEEIQVDIENVRSDEDYAYENLPETVRYSEKGEAMLDAIGNMEDALSSVGDAIDYLNSVLEQ